jgi:hypothetical protein
VPWPPHIGDIRERKAVCRLISTGFIIIGSMGIGELNSRKRQA